MLDADQGRKGGARSMVSTVAARLRDSTATMTALVKNKPDKSTEARLRPMVTSFTMKKRTQGKHGEKNRGGAQSVTCKIEGERGTNSNPNLWLCIPC
jgi:hypothetical protein